MPQKIRMWEVNSEDKLTKVSISKINLEKRLEEWLKTDITVLDPDLMVIGQQVPTSYGGQIDLLCLDSKGALVVVEIKRGKTPWEVAAQALDYASWVRELTFQEVEEIAKGHLKGTLEEEFSGRFKAELPQSFDHRSLIVAEEMDDSTERIVRYLSDLNVPINVATVQHFQASDGREILAQVYLVEPEIAAAKAEATSKKRTYALISELQKAAAENDVGHLYTHLASKVTGKFSTFANGKNSLGFRPPYGSGSYEMLFAVTPSESSAEVGLKLRLVGTKLMEHWGLTEEQMRNRLPDGFESEGYFRDTQEIDRFLDALKQ